MNINKLTSSELKGYLTGLIIGDGYMDKGVTKRAFRIKTIDKNWSDDITSKLQQVNTFKVTTKEIPTQIRDGVNHQIYYETTIKAHPYFAKKYHHFYDDYKNRVVSQEAYSWLNPIGLAQWYMGDGYLTLVGRTSGTIADRRIEFATDRYSKDEVFGLMRMLRTYFGIDCSSVKRGTRYRIHILQSGIERFFTLIHPYIVDSMLYKLNLKFDTKPAWFSEQFWIMQQNIAECDNPKYRDKI